MCLEYRFNVCTICGRKHDPKPWKIKIMKFECDAVGNQHCFIILKDQHGRTESVTNFGRTDREAMRRTLDRILKVFGVTV